MVTIKSAPVSANKETRKQKSCIPNITKVIFDKICYSEKNTNTKTLDICFYLIISNVVVVMCLT